MEGGVSPPARLPAQSAVSGRSDVPFRESFLQQMHSAENPGEACHGWNGGGRGTSAGALGGCVIF